jgi:subtilisin family serine protease
LVAICSGGGAFAGEGDLVKGAQMSHVEGELLVKYRSGVSVASKTAHSGSIGATVLKKFRNIGVQHLKLPPGLPVEDAIAVFGDHPDVEYAEPNYIYHATVNMPNDPDFGMIWGLDNTGQNVNDTIGTPDADMDMPEAWDIVTGSGLVVVGVIDTGVDYNHSDLDSNIWANPSESGSKCFDGVDDDMNGKVDDCRGWDFVDNDNNPMDFNSHGTHIAGIIGAVGNNANGIAGVNWSVSIMPLRALDASGSGDVSDIVSAINYANEKRADIINLSLGGPYYSITLESAVNGFDGLVIAAAGNESSNNDMVPQYPASFESDNMIAVAVSDQDDNLATFSNFGAESVDVSAPGVNIYSTVPTMETVFSDSFDDGNIADWTTGGAKDSWAVTTELYKSSSYSIADSPGGNYTYNTDSWIRSPLLNLGDKNGCQLLFELEILTDPYNDGLYVEASSDGRVYNHVALENYYNPISGDSMGSFVPIRADLSAYDNVPEVYLRFRLYSDHFMSFRGVHIDDVSVTCIGTSPGNNFDTFDGTSMAAPQVAGVAALIISFDPGLAYSTIKSTIMNNVDEIASMNGKLVSGGRVNAYKALVSLGVVPLPANPTDLAAAVVSSSRIDLEWTDNSTNETGFRIYRRDGGGGYAAIADVSNDSTAYSDTGLTAVTSYDYYITAYNVGGETIAAGSITASTQSTLLPAAPSGLTPTAVSSSRIDLEWIDNADNEDGFRIYRKIEGGGFSELTALVANSTVYSDTGLSASSAYYYNMLSYNLDGNSNPTAEKSATTHSPPLPAPPLPAAPSGLTASAVSSNRIDLEWIDNADDEDGFRIYRKIEGREYSLIADLGVDSTNHADTDLITGSTYYYFMHAYNDNGVSSFTSEVSETTFQEVAGHGDGNKCFIATAAYGSSMADEVMLLRRFRDDYLLTNPAGRALLRLYYTSSPPIADCISDNRTLKAAARIALTPIVCTVKYPFASGLLMLLLCGLGLRKRIKR